MFIQEIVIDGFKSYAHRTVIDGFDPHFNAITGLNGSGKSNILDSICFVLGITNLSQVRAGNLSELVYKQGQAGVNKASVTIIFNNEDETSSPVGYEQCSEVTVTRQVLIGGKSKYLINGRNAPAGQVTNLFHSVQLNVNNPHFLIMQGRITKVLNMKPAEILSMIEEAAGTRMYETKRVAAIKTIDKKQMKVDELNSVLAEEITPTLEKLRGEKQNYLTWSKNNADIERTERIVIASEFVRAERALENNNEGFAEMVERVAELKGEAEQHRSEVARKDVEIRDRSTKLSGEFGAELDKLKSSEEGCSKDLVKVTSSWQNSKAVVASARNDIDAARELLTETKKAASVKKDELSRESEGISARATEAKEAERLHEQLKADYQNLSAGLSSSQGVEGRTLPELISEAHSDSKTAEAKSKQAEMKIAHLSKTLENLREDMEKEARTADKIAKKKQSCLSRVEELKNKLRKLDFSETDYKALEKEKDELSLSVSVLREKVETLTARLEGRLRFEYSDPVRGFDRSKVKGLVATLVSVKQPENTTALEVVAGSKLYQVVVDEVITGKALLSKGKLVRRVTIIPLDKIQPRLVSSTVCDRASRIATELKTTALPAIELVGFDEEIRSAIEYVFGSSLVVESTGGANRICDETKTRTVTLEGDVYDPQGTISGGSRNNLGSTLSKLTEAGAAREEMSTAQARLELVSSRLAALGGKAAQHELLSEKLELASAELQNVERHLSQTTYGMLSEKHDAISKEVDAAQSEAREKKKEKEEKWALYCELKDKEQELTQERESRLTQIDQEMKEAKQLSLDKSSLAREAESRFQTLKMELESLDAEMLAAEQAVSSAEKVLVEAQENEASQQIRVGQANAAYEAVKAELIQAEEKMATFSSELGRIKSERADLVKKAESLDLEAKKLSVTITRIEKDRTSAERTVATMLKKYPWIENEKTAFGVEGGDYDFTAFNMDETKGRLQSLKEEQDVLAKKINKKVMGMIEKAEAEYTELLRKRKVVENDKRKIQAVIEELDIKKKSELERTWVKVNQDFGSIFSTLLPGASAKLEPPEGLEAWEGLEVRVAFGDVWKDSLSELSGGQRSLLALSLILALLLFKPAPMYILDEVDAALDLSHTQNIGNMLRAHFSQSQFIVVSLKEGMFNNANVIFRTKFLDGVSTVTRTIGSGYRALQEKSLNDSFTQSAKRVSRSTRARGKSRDKENPIVT